MLKLGIISNPFAKMNKTHPEHNTRMWYTLANDGLYKVTHTLIELEQVCQEYASRKINLVGIVGGDGSIGLVLSKILQAYGNENCLPKILLLKGGTINFLASNLGIKSSALTTLNDALFFIKNKMPFYEIEIRTIKVNGRLGFIFAGGIATAFLEEFYLNKTNSLGALVTVGKYMMDGICGGRISGKFKQGVQQQNLSISAHPIPLWGKKPKPNKSNNYSLVFASTVPCLPLNVRLFRKINLRSQNAELLAITETGIPLLTGAMEALLGNNITKYKGVDSTLFESVSIDSPSRIIYSLDGDLFVAEDGKINIEYGPSFIFCSPYYIAENDIVQKQSSKGS